jgi:hypothetical protein
MQLREETLALIGGPSSAMIAVVGEASRPLVSRVWGAEVVSEARRIRVLADPHAPGLRAALVAGRRVAVVFAACDDYRSVQLKGCVLGTDDGVADHDTHLRARYRDDFVAVNIPLGFPPDAAAALEPPSWFGITLEVDAVFDQTPRPGAGVAGEPR